MKTKGIQIKRVPYEEPYHLNLIIDAFNGRMNSNLEYYCNTDDLKKLGKILSEFPSKIPDEHTYEIGSTNPEDQWAYHLCLRAYTYRGTGYSAIQIVIDNNQEEPDEESSKFSIKAEPPAINRFGKLLAQFSKLKHSKLVWSVSGNEDELMK